MGGVSELPLRVKLVAAVLTLVAAALVVVSVGSAYFLRTYLTSRIDDELTGYLGSLQGTLPAEQPDGLRSDYLLAATDPVEAEVRIRHDPRFAEADLPKAIKSEAWYESAAGRGPFTAESGRAGQRWRVVVAEVAPRRYVAVAQSLADADYAVGRLVRIDVAAGMAVLFVLAGAGAAIVRRSLRPLNAIERTAGAIADGDLTQRVPDPEPGVPEPKSELGRLSRALNAMLSQIESAFAAREASESPTPCTPRGCRPPGGRSR